MLRSKMPIEYRRLTVVAVPLLVALSMSVSPQALASCTPPGTPDTTNTYTSGVDDVTCDDDHAPVAGKLFELGSDNDTLNVNGNPVFDNGGSPNASGVYQVNPGVDNTAIIVVTGGAGGDTFNIHGGDFHGQVQGGDGDDVFNISAGSFRGTVTAGNNNDTMVISGGEFFGSVNVAAGNDRQFVYGGTIHGEFQNGAGTDWMFLFGGTIEGTVEMQRGSVDSVIVVDGATLLSGFEMQNPNASAALAVDPTFYLRSGFVGAGTWGNANDSHFIFDPVNSQNPASIDPFADDIAEAFENGTPNINPHMLTIGEGAEDDDEGGGGGEEQAARVAFGNGNDTVDFVGAVNNGDGTHNLHFGEADEPNEEEVPIFDGDGQSDTANDFGIPGVPGTLDTMNVTEESNLLLGSIVNFENLNVSDESILTLTAANEEPAEGEEEEPAYRFANQVVVDGTSRSCPDRTRGDDRDRAL